MRILLLNDNPVARKLVALSAQYTKNDLTIIGSVAEIGQSDYDVVIVDDAYYSGETMAALAQKATYNVSILMAARGNNLSEGFDKVLNKPFLPADLIELLTVIHDTLPPSPPVVEEAPIAISPMDPLPPLKEERSSFSEPEPMVSFEDPLPPLKEVSSFSEPAPMVSFDDPLPPLKEEFSFSNEPAPMVSFEDPLPPLKEESSVSAFDLAPLHEEVEEPFMSFEEFLPSEIPLQTPEVEPAILDHEVVQDLKDLLKTTDADESDFSIGSFDIPSVTMQDEEPLPLLEDVAISPLLDEESYTHFDDMMMPESKAEKSFFDTSVAQNQEDFLTTEEDDYDLFIPTETISLSKPRKEVVHPHLEEQKSAFYSDTGVESSVHPHVEERKSAFYTDEVGTDLFDGIAEREMKLAMGEPVEEATYDIPVVMTQSNGNISSEGMEALQVLLKALSNEETANSLKGLNISININLNLGNGK